MLIPRIQWLLASTFMVLVFGNLSAANKEPVWAVAQSVGDGLKNEIVKLRAARKPQPMEGFLYSERVEWRDHHDTLGWRLSDKRVMQLEVNATQSEAIDEWPKGKVLVLCYDEMRGATLFDPESSMSVTVRSISERHPIDGYLVSLNANNTLEMNAVSQEADRLWSVEIDRCVREVLALKYLPLEVRQDFIALTKVRLEYINQQRKFGTASIANAYAGGTLIGPLSGSYSNRLYRDTYYQLADLLEYYSSFTKPR